VPPDAVFWAVATTGVAKVTIDGAALMPLGAGVPERYQFAPDTPLSLGAHELSISVLPPEGQLTQRDRVLRETTLSFEVTERPAFDTEGEIVAVRSYPLVYGAPQPSDREDLEGDCSADAVELTFDCYDIIPDAIIRLDLSTDPGAQGYVVGNYLLPADCKVFFPYAYSQAARPPFSIAAIMPTGLGPATPFTGEPEHVVEYPPGLFRENPPGWCSMAFGAPTRARAWTLTLLSSAALWFIRRRAWAR
jgi:hypothetical protein